MVRRGDPGVTLVELAVAMAILALLALGIGTLGVRAFEANLQGRIALREQQEMAYALRHFSEDVRQSGRVVATDGLTPSRRFVLEQPDGDLRYVTYQFADGRLQRGAAASADAAPASWQDVVVSEDFEVVGGSFAYFAMGGGAPDSLDAIRRIDLEGLRLKSREGARMREMPAISAVMRMAAQAAEPAGALVVLGGDILVANGSEKMIEFHLKNRTSNRIEVQYFAFDWGLPGSDEPIKQFWFGGVKWKDHKKDEAGELDHSVTIPAYGEVYVKIQFDNSMGAPFEGTMTLYADTDVERQYPYVVPLRVLPRN